MTHLDADPPLPDDLEAAHRLIRELLATLRQQIHLSANLQHQLEALLRRLYGKKSEKLDPNQLEVLTMRGRAFDRFGVSVTGQFSLPGLFHKLEIRLDEAPLKPLVAFVPPLAEQGLPNYAATGYVGIMVTGGTPPAIVRRLNASINEIVREPDFAKHFSAFGYEMHGGSVEEFQSFLQDDIERYRRLMRAAGIVPE